MNPPDKYARIICDEHGEQFLTEQQYDQQLSDPHRGWRCPVCWCYPCRWDDEYFEKNYEEPDADMDRMEHDDRGDN